MITITETIKVRQMCQHLLKCKGAPCHPLDGVDRRRQTATYVLAILDGVIE